MKAFSGVMSRIGIDLGSSQIRMYAGNRVVLAENSVAVIDNSSGAAVGFGVNALVRYHGAPEKYHLEWPVKHGVIVDYALTKGMLQYFLEKSCTGQSPVRQWRFPFPAEPALWCAMR